MEINDQSELFTPEQIRSFWERLEASRLQQYRPQVTQTIEDPVTGRHSRLAPGRAQRHVESHAGAL